MKWKIGKTFVTCEKVIKLLSTLFFAAILQRPHRVDKDFNSDNFYSIVSFSFIILFDTLHLYLLCRSRKYRKIYDNTDEF